jgi:serine protease Do
MPIRSLRLLEIVSVFFLSFILYRIAFAGDMASQPKDLAAVDSDEPLVKLIATTSKAFVFIGDGSGVVISADGYILTNYHVAGSKDRWTVRLGDEEQTRVCDVIGRDEARDLCLLKIRGIENAPFIKLGNSETLETGQRVLALGDPFKLGEKSGGPAASVGVISALHRSQGKYTDAIQTDCAINPGNSGGPLLNLSGELIGINGQIISRYGKNNTGVAFAIPSDQIKRALPELKSGDQPPAEK